MLSNFGYVVPVWPQKTLFVGQCSSYSYVKGQSGASSSWDAPARRQLNWTAGAHGAIETR